MTWLLLHNGICIATGSRTAMLERAEARSLCRRSYTPDGTERAPEMARGAHILPAVSAGVQRRAGRAA